MINRFDSCSTIDSNLLESLSQKQFELFVAILVDEEKRQRVKTHKSLSATFYMWFDEQASQLRFNIVSGHVAQLPFGCIVEIVNFVEPIWQKLKDSCFNQGISWSELEFVEDDEDDTEDEQEYTLQVYVQKI